MVCESMSTEASVDGFLPRCTSSSVNEYFSGSSDSLLNTLTIIEYYKTP